MQLDEAVDCYIATNQSVQSARTIRAHRTNAALFSHYLGRKATIEDLTDERVGGWFRCRAEQVSRNTLSGEASTMLALWRWAALNGHCRPPTIKAPARQQKTPQALTRDQVADLWRAAQQTSQVVGDVPGSIYWPALLYVLWQTAERIGAVRQLTWDNINLETGWITFPAATRKFGISDLSRPLTESATRAMRALHGASPGSPFGAEPGTGWYALWHALRAEAGLPKWVTPHTIRKSVASHMPTLDDACAMLGHSSSAITKRHYRDPRVGGETRLVDKLFDPGTPKRRSLLRWLTG